jgi:integrase
MIDIGKTKESQDSDRLWIDELEQETNDAAQFEFESMQELLDVGSHPISPLLARINSSPTLDFPVSDYSIYLQNRWILSSPDNSTEISVLFNNKVEGGDELAKMLTFFLLPQFHPLGTIRSYVSTKTYAWAYSLLEAHLFIPNCLEVTTESISLITGRMLNEALDRAKNIGNARQYFLLFFIIMFWHMLSANGLIPKSHVLSVSARLIDTSDRKKDIQNCIARYYKGWKSLSEQELARVINHSFFWTETVMPQLLEMSAVFDGSARLQEKNKEYRWEWLHKLFDRNDVGKGWAYSYKLALDKIKDALLVLVGLVMGLRKSELSELKFENLISGSDGTYSLLVTRFKTSLDPNFSGETEALPIPVFLAIAIQDFESLRKFDGNYGRGYIFEQMANSRRTTFLDRSVGKALAKLGRELGIESLHPHRLRKTIAEILINRSERNIDLIRMLFGHRSYKMTLRYIARNPYLVQSIATTMEVHYAEDFVDIINSVRDGHYSGSVGDRITALALARPELFTGQLLRMTVFNYISYLLAAGEPVYIKRTAVGQYCLSMENYTEKDLPPCLANKVEGNDFTLPDPSNCSLECKNLLVLEGAIKSLEQNIIFYSNLLNDVEKKLSRNMLMSKIEVNARHLKNLNSNSKILAISSDMGGVA